MMKLGTDAKKQEFWDAANLKRGVIMKKKPAAWLLMCLVALCAGVMLGVTRALTVDVIRMRTLAEAEEARRMVFTEADTFAPQLPDKDAAVDACYLARRGGATVGYVCTLTVQGYGGPIEVTVGVDAEGCITGVKVGGSQFAETPGLGAKIRDADFLSQFNGAQAPLTLDGEIDAVTGASRSSEAVTEAVNEAAAYAAALRGREVME